MADKPKNTRDSNVRLPMILVSVLPGTEPQTGLLTDITKHYIIITSPVMGKTESRFDLDHDLNTFGDFIWILKILFVTTQLHLK